MHPVKLLELFQLCRRLVSLWLEGRGVVDDQRQIIMGTQCRGKPCDLPFHGKIRLHQLNAQGPQVGQLGSLAAIAARHLPASGHQLLA